MTRIEGTRIIPLPIDDAYAFIADFDNVDEWDPGIVSAHRIGEAEPGVGTVFDVVSKFGGRELDLRYNVDVWEAPNRVVLTTTTPRFDGRDEITFRAVSDTATEVHYVAEFEFKGVIKLAEPFMRPMFDRLGRKALDGMVEATTAMHVETSRATGD